MPLENEIVEDFVTLPTITSMPVPQELLPATAAIDAMPTSEASSPVTAAPKKKSTKSRKPQPWDAGTLRVLSNSMRDMARGVAATGLFASVYDNINMVFKASEQIMGRTGESVNFMIMNLDVKFVADSQENGTCATIWPLWKAKLEDMRVVDLESSFDQAPPLSIDDVVLNKTETTQLNQHLLYCLLRIVVRHGGEKFAKFRDALEKSQPETINKIDLHKTPLHPLPGMNIDESTIVGNAEVVEAILRELGILNMEGKLDFDIIKIFAGDQLSIARLRALANIHAGHKGKFAGFGWGLWMPGLFHAKIADMHGFFVTHWGKPNAGTRNPGCLAFHNTCLHCSPITLTSLPPFCTCCDLVFVSLYARVLHCLLLASKKKTLDDYANSVDSWEELKGHAAAVIAQYADPQIVADLRWQ